MIQSYNSLSEKLLKKSIGLYLLSFVIAPLGYITKILISGEISVSDLGILYGVISLIILVSAFADLGVSESLKYFIPRYNSEKKYNEIKTLLCFSSFIYLLTGTIIGLVFYFGAETISTVLFKDPNSIPVLKIFSVFFIGLNVFQGITQFFLAVQNTLLYKICEFSRNFMILASVISINFIDIGSLQNFSFAWIIGIYSGVIMATTFFVVQYYLKYLRNTQVLYSKELIKNFMSYAFIVFLSAQASIILSQIDMQMILLLLSTTDAGYYSIYLSLMMIPFLIISPIFLLLLPLFSELDGEDKILQVLKIKNTLSSLFLIVGGFFSAFLFLFSQQISYILFGVDFLLSGEILRYSCLFLVFNLLFQINFNILGGIGKIKYKLYITLIVLGLNIVGNYILISQIGVAGAALTTGIGWLIIWLLSEYALGKEYRISINRTLIIKNICVLGLLILGSLIIYDSIFTEGGRLISLGKLILVASTWFAIFIIGNRQSIIEIKSILAKE